MRTHRAGFTLAELLIAIGVFAVIISIAIGGFVRAMRTQRQVVALVGVNGNASVLLEQIAREVRTGRDFNAGVSGCGQSQLAFTNTNDAVVVYGIGANHELERSENSGVPISLTGSDLSVERLSFCLMGNAAGDGLPPRVTISMSVRGKAAGIEGIVTTLQTTISARQLDE